MGFIRRLFQEETVTMATFGLGVSTFFVNFGVHTFLAEYYQKYLQKYNTEKEPVKVKPILDFEFKNVQKDLKFTEWNTQYMRLFINKELDPYSFGSTETRCGVWISVPEHYQEFSEEGIKNTNILIDGKPVKWDSADGERFLKSLMLSKKALRYVLARELAMHNTFYIQIKTALPTMMILFTGLVGEQMYNKLKLHHRPFSLSLTMGAVLILLFSGLTLFLEDGLYFLYDKGADDRVCELGISYIEGGVEFYSKRIERNKALRNLMKKGQKYYSVGGNENTIWRSKGLPNTAKLSLMKERLSDLISFQEATKIPPVNPNPHPVF